MSTRPKLSYRPQDVEALTGMARSTIYKKIRSKQLPAHRSGRQLFIHHDDLEAFLRGLPAATYPVMKGNLLNA